MKIGVYNQWLATMGGGERYMLSVAAHLARQHEVDVLSGPGVDVGLLSSRLRLDLSRLRFCDVDPLPAEELTALTSTYDVFVNGSFLSALPGGAPTNLLLVYFPMKLPARGDEAPIASLAAAARQLVSYPRFGRGFFPPETIGGRSFRWTGATGRVLLHAPTHLRGVRLSMTLGRLLPANGTTARVTVVQDGELLGEVEVPASVDRFLPFVFRARPFGPGESVLELRVDRTERLAGAGQDSRALGVALAELRIAHPSHWPWRLLARLWPRAAGRIARDDQADPRRFLASYHSIVSISEYTRRWTREYWQRDSQILYPPVDVEGFAPAAKRQAILSVGRFFRGSHNKKHLEMVRAFRDLVDRGLSGWELHLAGGVAPARTHREYLEEVRAAAAGYPILLHPDVPFERLRGLYGEATIYWHACGLGEDESQAPERFEHFGITTVEAMAAGCVPLVLDRAGLRETVEDGVSGLLWGGIEELQRATLRVIGDAELADRLRAGALARARCFSTSAFAQRLDAIVATTVALQGQAATAPRCVEDS